MLCDTRSFRLYEAATRTTSFVSRVYLAQPERKVAHQVVHHTKRVAIGHDSALFQ
jgi:hypothetical protein